MEAYIFDAVRTPRGRARPDGKLHTLSPLDLASIVLRALRDRNALDTAAVDDVILGCADTVDDQGSNLARSAALYAGYSQGVPGMIVSRFCGSGLDAVNIAAAKIMAGQADLMVAGGVEMMSVIPMMASGGPSLSDARFNGVAWGAVPQGIAADLLATLNGYTRTTVDAYAVESQTRAARAIKENRFARSLIPVTDCSGALLLDKDEHPRPGTTVDLLAKLKPAFAEMGERLRFDDAIRFRYPEVDRMRHVHHAGNSSGMVDGASAVLVGTREGGARFGLKPRARIVSTASLGAEPCVMLSAPPDTVRRCLARAGIGLADVDLYEVNEAFAAVPLHFIDQTGVPHEKVNVNGGAIALGHPIGATGGMLVGALVDELERSGGDFGCATMCTGLGMGVATLIQRVPTA